LADETIGVRPMVVVPDDRDPPPNNVAPGDVIRLDDEDPEERIAGKPAAQGRQAGVLASGRVRVGV